MELKTTVNEHFKASMDAEFAWRSRNAWCLSVPLLDELKVWVNSQNRLRPSTFSFSTRSLCNSDTSTPGSASALLFVQLNFCNSETKRGHLSLPEDLNLFSIQFPSCGRCQNCRSREPGQAVLPMTGCRPKASTENYNVQNLWLLTRLCVPFVGGV